MTGSNPVTGATASTLARNTSLHSSQALDQQPREQSSLPDDHVLVGSSIKSSLLDNRAESNRNDEVNWLNNQSKAEDKIAWLEQDSENRARKSQW